MTGCDTDARATRRSESRPGAGPAESARGSLLIAARTEPSCRMRRITARVSTPAMPAMPQPANFLAHRAYPSGEPITNNLPFLNHLPRGKRHACRERTDLRRLLTAAVAGRGGGLRQPRTLMGLVVWISAGIVLIAIVRVTVKLLSKPPNTE